MFKQISGSIGSVIASICCLGFAPALAALSAVGLGFLINDAILIPLLALFLGLTVWGLLASRHCHGINHPFYLGSVGAAAALLGILIFMPVHILGLLMLIAAAVWDIVLLRQCRRPCEPA
jgi:mercuric ion transport protein